MNTPPNFDDLAARLRAAGVTDEASLRAALERDPQLKADYEAFLASPEVQATLQMNALLQVFAAVQDPDQMRAFWQAVPTELEGPFIKLVEELIRQAPPDADPNAVESLRAKLANFKRLCEERPADNLLLQAMQAFISAEAWNESRRIVEAHPELLSDEALATLERLIAAARAQGDAEAERFLTEHRDLLQRCREAGIPRTFAEKLLPPELLQHAEAAGLLPEQVLAMMEAAAQMLPELRDALAELAASGIAIRSMEDLERALVARPDLRAKLEAAAQAQAMGAGGPEVPPHFRAGIQQAQGAEQQYLRTGDRAALDEAAAAWERILGHPDFPAAGLSFRLAAMNNAGGAFLRRYWAGGWMADLERALALLQQAVALTPPDAPDRAGYLNNLAIGLSDRYARTGALDDLEAAIAHWQQAVALTPPDAPDRAMHLNNLAAGLRARYARTGALALDDLEAAIAASQQAVALTPPDAPDRAMHLNNLAAGLRARYARTGAPDDLEAAIAHWQQAVALTPPDAPARASWLNNLAAGLRARYARTGALDDLEAAIAHWQQARDGLHAAVRTGLAARSLAGEAAAITRGLVAAHLRRGDPAAALGDAEAGRGARLRLDLARSGRTPAGLAPAEAEEYQRLAQETRNVASALRGLDREAGLDPAARQARRAELTRRRAELDARLDALEAGDPAFAARPPGFADMAALARRHGFTIVFLVPTNEAELGTLAFLVGPDGRGAPEVLHLAGLTRNRLHDLLFALPEGMTFSEAPNALGARWALDDGRAPEDVGWLAAYWLTHLARARDRAVARPNDWEPRARRLWHATMQRVLKELGETLMGPLAERLAARGAHRVVLIPGDRLGLLPLHAAPSPLAPLPGEEEPGVRAFLDAFEVSYAPSVAALAAALARAGVERGAPTLAAVANPDGSLAFADDEVAAIAAGFDGRAQVAYGPAATRAWLLAHAGQADYLKLSTHGSFAPGEPEQSSLLLAHPAGHTWPLWRADISPERQELAALQAGCERLTLDDIWAGRLPLKPGCVVSLDACETAQTEPGEEADESLGFPAALLGAGAATVIASLWAVDDFSTSLLMTEAYRRMLAGERPSLALQRAGQWLRRLPKAEVLAWLDAAIAALETEERAGAWERLPLGEYAQRRYRLAALANRRASLNDAPEDPPFAHPVWWAAFAAYGA